jgi:hypothetical protein
MGGARTAFTAEQIAHIKATLLEKIPQGWTIRQILAESDMCSMAVYAKDNQIAQPQAIVI